MHIKHLFSFVFMSLKKPFSPSLLSFPHHHHLQPYNPKLLPQTLGSTRTMAVVPTSITVARFPQQPAHKPYPRYPPEAKDYEFLETLKVELPTSSAAAAAPPSDISLFGNQTTMLYDPDRCLFQPKISLQPDVVERHWSDNAWANRAVVGDDKYHVLFTTSLDSTLTANRHVSGKVRGDVFVLKLSDSNVKDGKGRRYYVDLDPKDLDWEYGRWEGLAKKVERFMEARGRLMARYE